MLGQEPVPASWGTFGKKVVPILRLAAHAVARLAVIIVAILNFLLTNVFKLLAILLIGAVLFYSSANILTMFVF